MIRRTTPSHRPALLLLLCAPLATACFQTLDSSISGNPTAAGDDAAPIGSPDAGDGAAQGEAAAQGDDGGAVGPLCQNGNTIDPARNPVFCVDNLPGQVIVTQTPGIELPDGSTTNNPCDLMEQESFAIRQMYCSVCHGRQGVMGAYHTLLDDNYPTGGPTLADGHPTLFGTTSSTATGPTGMPTPLIVPGDHYNSRLYQFVASGQMPPPVGITSLPKPTISDIALLGAWIDNMPTCFNLGSGGGADGSVDASGGDDGGGSGDDGGGG